MAKDEFIEQTFPIKCYGRNRFGKKIFEFPVDADVSIHQHIGDEENLCVNVICPFIGGGHGHKCKAPINTKDHGYCVYSCDIPYCLERNNDG